jgi:muconate cycloisomerase
MAGAPVIRRLTVYPLLIPLRHRVSHAAAQRKVADPIVVEVELSDGTLGYGETVPRSYVTGESAGSVLEAIQGTFVPFITGFRAGTFPGALETIEGLPWRDSKNQLVPAARAAVELALLDATLRVFHREVGDVVQWMGLAGFGAPGNLRRVRYSGVVASAEAADTLRKLRWMYWAGLRDFKLKVGVEGDHEQLVLVSRYLRRPLAAGRATLRLDANGAWDVAAAVRWLDDAARAAVSAIEQPLPKGEEDRLPELRDRIRIPIYLDESLVTIDDAQRLIALGVAGGFNIRISKCGGWMPSLNLAALARRNSVQIQLGCMVGETSILSAAGIRFLEVCPGVRWAEGCYGRHLLHADVTVRSLRFGYGGRARRLTGPGWGIDVDAAHLPSLCEEPPVPIHL